MHRISAAQIKAARAIIGWSQDDLARSSGLSITTIRNLEAGSISPRGTTNSIIQKTLENAGVEFIDLEGVRRRMDEVSIHHGAHGRESFFDDMLQSAWKENSEIVIVVKSQKVLLQACGIEGLTNTEPLKRLGAHVKIRCLLAEAPEQSLFIPSLQFRIIPKHLSYPTQYFVYGDKCALMLMDGRNSFKFVVFNLAAMAQTYRQHFETLWDQAPPLFIQSGAREENART